MCHVSSVERERERLVHGLQDALEAIEIKLQDEMDAKMKAVHDMLLLQIEALETRTAQQSEKVAEQRALRQTQQVSNGSHREINKIWNLLESFYILENLFEI